MLGLPLSGNPLTCHQGLPKFPITLALFSTKELLHDGWGLSVPRTMSSTPFHTKPEGQRHAGKPPRLQGWTVHQDTSRFTQEPAHKVQHLALTLYQEKILELTLIKLVLSLSIWSLSTLVGLEVFFNVYGVSPNSSNIKMVGRCHMYSPQTWSRRL